MKKKVFISFDFDQDRGLRDLLVGQSKNPESPFEVIDSSLHEAAPEKNWADKAREKIKTADMMIVIVGALTCHAKGVQEEVKIARELNKKIVQLIGHKDQPCPRVPNAGILYRWTWNNLQKILAPA